MNARCLLQNSFRAGFLTALLVVLGTLAAWASAPTRDRTITGKVTSQADGSSLAGVNIILKGTQTGTSSDASGAFSLSVPEERAVLVFSFIGYTSQEITVGNQSTINVALVESAENLNEVPR